MSSCLLAASPSWYSSRVSDCSEDGHFIFGAKNTLYLLNISQKEPSFTDQLVAHQERIVSVSLCHVPGHTNKCVTTSEDGKVRIWDLHSKTLVQEHTQHQGQPSAVHWSPVDPNLIVSGDDKGMVVTWHMEGNNIKLLSPEPGHIFCVTCSPHDRDHVAIGYKSGNIILADISRRGLVLERLRGHDEEIHSICWCPVLGESLSEDSDSAGEATSGSLLVSGSRDRSIKVWSTSDGRNLLTLKLPTNTGHKRDRYEEQNRNRAWLTLCWPQNRPRQFISSTYNGDLLLWDLTRSGKQKWETFSTLEVKGHNRIVFNVSSSPPNHDLACSISMDRQIVLWNLNTLEAVHKVSTLGGFVYDIAASPLNPNRLALGVGDNMIRVCNMDTPAHVLETVTLWQGIKSKVTTLSWHPVREGHLAYGTDDGRVGIYDVLSQKPPFVSSTYHKRTVYVVIWGPPCPALEHETGNPAYFLYSCGDGTILQHDPYKLEKPATDLNKIICKITGIQKSQSRSEISFKPDWSAVALGNEDGSVDVYSIPDLQLKCSIQVHRKLVNVVRWHPEFTAESGDASQCRSWLAIATNECFISIIDLQSILEGASGPYEKGVRQITETMCRLEGHSNRITGLSWSNHQEARLVSASYDGSAQVWDVKNVQPLANYRGHSGRLFCVQWSLMDPDIISTGADDFSLHSWHVAKQEHTVPPKGKEWTKKKKGKGKSKAIKDRESNEDTSTVNSSSVKQESTEMDTLKDLLAAKKKELESQEKMNVTTPESQELDSSDVPDADTGSLSVEGEISPRLEASVKEKASLQSTSEMNKPKTNTRIDGQKKVSDGTNKKKRRERSMFPVFNTMETRGKAAVQQDTMDLASLLYSGENNSRNCQLNRNQTHLGLFTDRNGLYQHLDTEEKHHTDHGNNEQMLLLNLWKGDLGDTLRQAAAKKQLNDWHMAMAPTVSPKLWRELCVLYAKQLEDDGFLHKAASYYLNVHKVHDAVEVFARHNQYRDAVSLALARLSGEDPIFEKLYAAWAVHLLQENSYEQAAQCYLALRKPIEAASVLARRSDCQSLRAATHLTLVSGEMNSFKNFAVRFVQECLTIGDWQSASEVLSWHESLKGLALYSMTHELLCQELDKLNIFNGALVEEPKYSLVGKLDGVDSKIPKFLLDPKVKGKLSTWQAITREGQPLIDQILGCWCFHNKDNITNEKLLHHIKELSDMVELKQTSVAVKQVIQSVALQVSIGMLCLLLCDKEESAHWWTVAMATCKEAQHPQVLIALCKVLLPQGPEKLIDLQQQVTAIRLSASESSVGIGPAASREVDESCTDSREDGKDALWNGSKFCSSYDCLTAFYSYAVLLDGVDMENQKESKEPNNRTEITSENKMSESLETFDVLEEDNVSCKEPGVYANKRNENEFHQVANSCDIKHSSVQHLSDSQVKSLSQNLLWHNQVKKLELQESLTFIQKAMKGMISKHNVQHYDQSTNCVERNKTTVECVGNTEPAKALLTPPAICRSVSGEYLHMKPGSASFKMSPFASPKQSPKRLFSPDDSLSRMRCDSEGHEEMMPSIEENGSPTKEERRSPDTMTHSGIMQTRIYTKAHNIFSTEMSESTNSDIEKSPTLESSDSHHASGSSTTLSTLQNGRSTAGVASENAETMETHSVMPNQPIDLRYCGEDVTLSGLSDENQRVTAELHDVTCMMKSTPFPHPLESAKLLCQLLLLQPVEQREVLNTVCQWASDHAFLSEHQLFFSTLLPD